jgi:cytochrome bd ubiquinol oxidase subunit II
VILPLLSASFAAFALTLYVVLDGFDLGVGMLLLFQTNQAERNHMVDSITPTWDGNETWLIMAGVTLLAAFPIAYGILLPALYIPLIAMLLALGLRGVSFEFRGHAKRLRGSWDLVFAFGSLVAALMQGMIVGALLQGVSVQGSQYDGGPFDFASPLSALCGAAVAVGYMILGSGWLFWKGNLLIERFVQRCMTLLSPLFACLSVSAIAYAIVSSAAVRSCVELHKVILTIIACTFVLMIFFVRPSIGKKTEILPFLFGLSSFLLGIGALVIVVYPDIIPFRLSLWQAAASRLSQVFLLVGAIIVTPVVIGYSLFSYWIFRGKTPAGGWEP